MGVGIALCKKSCWLPAGWAGRGASDRIMRELAADAPASLKARLEHMHDYPGAIAFFDDATREEVTLLCAAAERALERLKSEGAAGWVEPSFFPGFLACFEELVEYLHLDPRSSGGVAADLKPPSGRTFRFVGFRTDE
jgi:hypothetical protein